MTAPATIVVDTEGLEALVAEVAAQDSYGFDTEFHTERTYVPDLALIQIAWADKMALVDPLAVDPAPLASVFGGPGIAVAHAASQDLDVLMAACGAVPATVFDTQIVAGFLGLSTPSLSRLVDHMLGVSLPKADRLSDWLVRPISERQITYALNDVAHLLELRDVLTEKLRALGRLEWALSECDQVLGDRTPARVPEEAWWKLGDIRGMSRRSRAVAQEVAAWRERTAAETQPAPPHGALGPRAPRHVPTAAAQRRRAARHPRRRRAPPGAGPGRRDHAGGRTRPRAPPGPDPDALGGAGRAGSAGRRGRVLGRGAPDRRRPRFRPGPAGHAEPTSPSCSAASRAGSIRGGAAPSSGTRCAG